MDDVKNQRSKIFITIGLLLLIMFLCELFLWKISSEMDESMYLLWMLIIIPAIIIATIGVIVHLVKDAPVYQSFFRKIFKVWLIVHIIWSILLIWFYIALSSVRWI